MYYIKLILKYVYNHQNVQNKILIQVLVITNVNDTFVPNKYYSVEFLISYMCVFDQKLNY